MVAAEAYLATGEPMDATPTDVVEKQIKPGTLTVTLEPLYEGGLDDVTPGSSCIANAYTTPSHQSLFLDLVGPEDLMNAISLNSMQFNLSRIAGPMAAGFRRDAERYLPISRPAT